MKPLALARAGVFALATGAATVAAPSIASAATCLFNSAGQVTNLYSSDSFRRLRAPALSHRGLAAVVANRHGSTVYNNGRPVQAFQGLGFRNTQEVINYCARATNNQRDERSGSALRIQMR